MRPAPADGAGRRGLVVPPGRVFLLLSSILQRSLKRKAFQGSLGLPAYLSIIRVLYLGYFVIISGPIKVVGSHVDSAGT